MNGIDIDHVRVKICGITNGVDALAAIAAGADALGFNLYPGSKRFIRFEREAEWLRDLPPFVCRVAVLVNATMEDVTRAMDSGCFDRIQLHGDETPEFCQECVTARIPIIKALGIKDEQSLEVAGEYPVRQILLDTYDPANFGGTGRAFDWNLAREFLHRYPTHHIILSGGLHPGNVREAVEQVHPYAVDVASGVETAPGKKDADLMRRFVAAAHGQAEAQ